MEEHWKDPGGSFFTKDPIKSASQVVLKRYTFTDMDINIGITSDQGEIPKEISTDLTKSF